MRTFSNKTAFLSIFVLIGLLVSAPVHALKLGKYFIDAKSKLWFEGSSTIKDFECITYRVDGQAILDSVPGMTKIQSWQNSTEKYFIDASFKIRTRTLDCGNEVMNDDMYEALRAEDYTDISFKLETASLIEINVIKKHSKVKVGGFLTVAGKSKRIEMIVTISEESGESLYRVQCSTNINMRDYEIEPPSAFLGLIKADENLTLFLDLYIGI